MIVINKIDFNFNSVIPNYLFHFSHGEQEQERTTQPTKCSSEPGSIEVVAVGR